MEEGKYYMLCIKGTWYTGEITNISDSIVACIVLSSYKHALIIVNIADITSYGEIPDIFWLGEL